MFTLSYRGMCFSDKDLFVHPFETLIHPFLSLESELVECSIMNFSGSGVDFEHDLRMDSSGIWVKQVKTCGLHKVGLDDPVSYNICAATEHSAAFEQVRV